MSTDTVLVIIGCVLIISALLGRLMFPSSPTNIRVSVILRVSLFVFGLALLSIGIFPWVKPIIPPISTSTTEAPRDMPIHVSFTTKAWLALKNENYTDAIKHADDCIDQFEQEAFRIQDNLETNAYQLPELQNLTKEQKDEIFRHGVMNDVATCWFIKGRALEKSNKKEDAKAAYSQAAKLKFAFTWDPMQQKFWSTSQAASDRLQALTKK